jgi:FkbM family methyltransferase
MTARNSIASHEAIAELMVARSVGSLRESLLATFPSPVHGALDRIAILGTGAEGLRLAQICRREGIEIVGAYDGNARKRGLKFADLIVYPAEALTLLSKDVTIVVASHRVLGACESLRSLGYVTLPLGLLQVAMPEKFPPHVFYEGLLEDLFENREEYRSLFDIFSDDASRQTLDAVIGYRLSMNPLRLRRAIDWDLYGAFNFGEDEVYVDGGTYNGDSIQFFIDRVSGRYCKIYGFEPDGRTFEGLKQRFGRTEGIELHDCGLYSKTGSLGFSADSSRHAKIDEDSGTQIRVAKLDDVVNGPVTFIKLNIEGAEIAALEGSRSAIANWSPKLAISAYHRPSDLWRLCRLIRTLNPRYQLSLRQHDGGIIETVIYALA